MGAVISRFINNKKRKDSKPNEFFNEENWFQAVEKGDIDTIKMFIKHKFDINIKHKFNDNTALILSIYHDINITKLLITAGAGINIKGCCGNTALMWASKNGCTDVVKLLINMTRDCDNTADTNIKGCYSNIALMWASCTGHIDVVKENINLNMTGDYDNTAFMFAIKHDNIDIARLLLDAGADVNAKSYYNYTALIWASEKNKTDIIKFLINAGANVNAKDRKDNTALTWAIKHDNTEIVKLLEDIIIII